MLRHDMSASHLTEGTMRKLLRMNFHYFPSVNVKIPFNPCSFSNSALATLRKNETFRKVSFGRKSKLFHRQPTQLNEL